MLDEERAISMLEPPPIASQTLHEALRTGYGITVAELTFLPLGKDAEAWAYRVRAADGTPYFLKVRTGISNASGLLVPRYLHEQGVTNVAAPLPSTVGSLWVAAAGFALVLYPYIEGVMGADGGMTAHHWTAFGSTLRQVHTATLSAELVRRMRHETFTPAGSAQVRRVHAHLATHKPTDSIGQELAAFWHAHHEEIRTLVVRGEHLGRQLRATNLPRVLCHADAHTWNLLIGTADQVWLVDWDETVLAPKERDLMFVVGGIAEGLVGPEAETWFFAGYGPTTIHPLALAYYRHAWAVGDIGAFAEQVFLSPETGDIDRQDAARLFKSLFAPGNIVALARASDISSP
jgi:spectinomycin phosphotransferase